ncbi:MAG TPA: hypothetical protein VNA28_11405 [Solirubrobacteraceae bacterium]|nr:hypothetical protein [Solirubrobacteraceae bacterium]
MTLRRVREVGKPGALIASAAPAGKGPKQPHVRLRGRGERAPVAAVLAFASDAGKDQPFGQEVVQAVGKLFAKIGGDR